MIRKEDRDGYYRAKQLISNPKFQEKIGWLRNRFSGVGCPIPDRGFKSYKSYLTWREKYWNMRKELESSKEYERLD